MDKNSDKSSSVIGGTTLIGTGIGFLFLPKSALIFVACILIGIGSGLLITSLLSAGNNQNQDSGA